jgi:signal transduction histidine kinase
MGILAYIRSHLRLKIGLGLGALLLVVVSIWTGASLVLQDRIIRRESEAEAEMVLDLTRKLHPDILDRTKLQEIATLLKSVEGISNVIEVSVVPVPDTLRPDFAAKAPWGWPLMLMNSKLEGGRRILLDRRTPDDKNLSVYEAEIRNFPRCAECHLADADVLGHFTAVVRAPARSSIAAFRRLDFAMSGVIFAAVLSTTIGAVSLFILRPVKRMSETMLRVAKDDLTARVEPRGNDELRWLGEQFNAMVEQLAQKREEVARLHQREIERVDRLATTGEIASGLAHEIKNPLAGIKAAMQVIREGFPAEHEHRRVAGAMLTEVEKIERIIGDLLDYVRVSSPEMDLYDADQIASHALFLVANDCAKGGIEVVRDIPAGLPRIRVDAQKIQQVFLNVLLNAIHAMPRGGTLTIRAAAVDAETPPATTGDDARVVVQVQDTGSGIPPEIRGEVFKAFFTTKPRGTGLGLAIADKIMRQHSGSISLESGPGVGTVARMEFPAVRM